MQHFLNDCRVSYVCSSAFRERAGDFIEDAAVFYLFYLEFSQVGEEMIQVVVVQVSVAHTLGLTFFFEKRHDCTEDFRKIKLGLITEPSICLKSHY